MTATQSECLDRIDKKLDTIIEKLNNMDGLRGFGTSLLANIIGNSI